MSEIWSDLLRVERVGRDGENFFNLGGHSLLAIKLIDRMRASGLTADIRSVFASTTLAELAENARTEQADASREVAASRDVSGLPVLDRASLDRVLADLPEGAGNLQDVYLLAPLQEGMLFHHLLGGPGDTYLQPFLTAFRTREALDRFLAALQQVLDRHDILRTGFAWEGLTAPMQVVRRRVPLPHRGLDELRARSGHRSSAQGALRLAALPHRCPKGAAPALLRRTRWGESPLVAAVDGPPSRFDHETLNVLIEEAQAFERGEGEALPRALPFRDFVAASRVAARRGGHEAHFRRVLAGIDESTAPFGLSASAGATGHVGEARQMLELPVADEIRRSARELGVSAAALMHVAWALVVARTSGRRDVVFGTVLLGRMHGGPDVRRVVGMFINTLPVRLSVREQSVRDAVREMRTRSLGTDRARACLPGGGPALQRRACGRATVHIAIELPPFARQ